MLIHKKSKIKGMGSFFIDFKGGSNKEVVGERGLHHLAEHLVCKGWDHLFKEFTSLGINFNAETHSDRVIFYWKGLDDEITKLLDRKEGLKILGRTPSREEFENEKKIVLQEYDDSFSDPQDALFTNIGRKYFNNYGPIGFRKDLEETSYEQMVEFIRRNFSTPTDILRIYSGKNKFQTDIEYVKYKEPKNIKYGINEDLSILEYTATTENTELCDWMKLDIDSRISTIINSLWSFGLESPLYQEIREKRGLVYGLHLWNHKQDNEQQMIFSCSTRNEDEVRKVFKDVISRPEEFITKERYDSIINGLLASNKTIERMNYSSYRPYLNKDSFISVDYVQALDYDNVMSEVKRVSDEFVNNIVLCSAGSELKI